VNKQQIKETLEKVMNGDEVAVEDTKELIRNLSSVNITLEDETFAYNEEESPRENLLKAINSRIDSYFRVYWGV
jgi:hypothetical protein